MTTTGRGPVLALDVDGVLLDPTRGGRGPWSEAVGDRWAVDGRRLQAAFFARDWSEVVVGRAPIEPALAAALVELGWPMAVEDLLDCWFEADCVVDEEVAEAARTWAAAGARLVLVTNQEHRRARYLEDRLGAVLPLAAMAYSAALGLLKSDPRFFPAAATALGLDPGATVVLVDDTVGNVEAARLAGWAAVHYRPGPSWRTEISAALWRRPGGGSAAPSRRHRR